MKLAMTVFCSFLSVFSVLTFASTAGATIVCSGAQSCTVANLPMVNQNDRALMNGWRTKGGETMLCGPAVATMALSSLGQSAPGLRTNSETHQMLSMPLVSAVEFAAKSMKTRRESGTDERMLSSYLAKRAMDFSKGITTSLIKNSKTVSANSKAILSQMQSGQISMIQYGRFAMNCKGMANSSKRCFFSRLGGHIVIARAINGTEVTIHNPAGAIVKKDFIRNLPSQDSSGRPMIYTMPSNFSVQTAASVNNEGIVYGLIEHLFGIGGRPNRR